MGLDKSKFRYIEGELFAYEQSKRDLQELKADIIESTVYPDTQVSGSDVSNTTAARGIRLVTNAAIARMERTIWAIDKSMAILSDDHRALFCMRFKQNMPWKQVCVELPCSDRTFFRMRREIVLQVATFLGLFCPDADL